MVRILPSRKLLSPFIRFNTELIPSDELPKLPRSRCEVSKESVLNALIIAISVFVVTWHLYYALERPITRREHTSLHFVMLLPLVFLMDFKFDIEGLTDTYHNVLTFVFTLVAIGTTTYAFIHLDRWMEEGRYFVYNTTDLTVAGLLVIVFVYAAWRSFGFVFVLVTLAGFAYGYLGPYFPEIFNHSGFSLERLIIRNTISIGGMFDNITFVVATWVVIFILYAGIIEGYGGMKYIMFLGMKAQNLFTTGVVQTAVTSSLLVGSVNAASMANVATTGAFTIPLMKRNGIKSKFAAAIEALASTGGQIMPPVMGAASFLLADFVGIPYSTVLLGALLPALGFYFTVALSAHLVTLKHGWVDTDRPTGGRQVIDDTSTDPTDDSIDEDSSPDEDDIAQAVAADTSLSMGDHLVIAFPILVSIVVLLYYLVVRQWDPLTSGTYATFTLIVSGLIRDLLVGGLSFRTIRNWLSNSIEGCRVGATMFAPITAVVVPIAIVINIFSLTGLPQRLSFEIVSLTGGSMVLLLLATMFISILLGLGIPTVAAYIMVAVFVAPALTEFGIEPLVAHMFVFYFAVLSTLTPPVALSCAVASGISGADFMEVVYETIRLGLAIFLIPFIFVANPDLVLWSSALSAAIEFVLMSVSIASVILFTVGYTGYRAVADWQRVGFLGGALLVMFVPLFPVRIGAAAVILVSMVVLYRDVLLPSTFDSVSSGEPVVEDDR